MAIHAGGKVVTPMKAMKSFVKKADKAVIRIMKFNVFGNEDEDEADYTVGLAIGGDCFALRDQIKSVDKKETEINGVCIPMVENALPARFISERFLHTLIAGSSPECKTFTTKLNENFKVCKNFLKFVCAKILLTYVKIWICIRIDKIVSVLIPRLMH